MLPLENHKEISVKMNPALDGSFENACCIKSAE